MKRLQFFLLLAVLFLANNAGQCLASNRHDFELGASCNVYAFGMKPGLRALGPGVYFEYKFRILDYLSVGARADYMFSKEAKYDGATSLGNYNQGGLQILADLHLPYSRAVSPFISVLFGPGYGAKSKSGQVSSQEFYLSYGARIGVRIKDKVSISFMHAFDYDPKINRVWGLYSSIGLAVGYCF